uniref:Histone-lysine N-methyltransferase SETMAR-like n=1 Tax=Geotrypetes seraphini TaxID=260995 RepID=A0A6P8P164_GEOSA|nr:histone-lysine N-methyltransferase SETMAR-like [Geotrypetes seraphini]
MQHIVDVWQPFESTTYAFIIEMEKEFRAVIKHFYLKKWTAAQIKFELDEVRGDSAPALKTIYFWINEFKRGCTCTEDKVRSGHPVEITMNDMIEKIHCFVMEDRQVKVYEIAETVGISSEQVHNILNEKLHMRKLCAQWVPQLLTFYQKCKRKDISMQCLMMFNRNPQEFLCRFVTVDETWIHLYTPESQQKSKQWTMTGENAPKKAKTVLSPEKVMATVFWDSQGIILIDYLAKGKTTTGAYYASLLDRLKDELKEKRPRLAHKKVLFHQDNTPFHTSTVVVTKLHELGFEVILRPPYSPDLAPSYFFLFPNLKIWLCGKKFLSNEDVIDAVNEYFAEFDKTYFSDGMKKLETRWAKCIALNGDYVEK